MSDMLDDLMAMAEVIKKGDSPVAAYTDTVPETPPYPSGVNSTCIRHGTLYFLRFRDVQLGWVYICGDCVNEGQEQYCTFIKDSDLNGA